MMLDINVNYNGFTLSQAREFLAKTLPGAEVPSAKFESTGNVARLLAWPAQGHSYEYGEQMFNKLRHDEESRLGTDFDLKDFHRKILVPGEATFKVIRQRVTNQNP